MTALSSLRYNCFKRWDGGEGGPGSSVDEDTALVSETGQY